MSPPANPNTRPLPAEPDAKPLAADPGAESLAAAHVAGIVAACPAYRPGTRPIHAPGIVATGLFSATPVASCYTTAEHFAGLQVPVTVRFSNGTGDLGLADTEPLVRGMAVRFHLGDATPDGHGVIQSERHTDLIAMTLPVFFARTVDEFRAFLDATVPARPTPVSWPHRVRSMLRLETPYPTPPAGVPTIEQKLYDYATTHPEAEAAVAYLGSRFVPASYTTCSYHAVHAFSLTGPDGACRWVRFHWEPVEGVKKAPPGASGKFLRAALEDRIRDGQAEFVLRIQLAEPGDDTRDPTRAWPQRRPRVVIGHLRLTAVVADQHHGGELLGFDPTTVVPGMGLSDDPTLLFRGVVYPYSHARRLADGAPTTSPVPPPSSGI